MLAAFTVICVVVRRGEVEDVTALAGLNQRSPLLATAMTLAMVSLAGVPAARRLFWKIPVAESRLVTGKFATCVLLAGWVSQSLVW